jgi:hypothetical protein
MVVGGIEFLAMAAALFLPAGSLHWPTAWIFPGLLIASSLPITWWLRKYDPGLVEERMRFRPQLSRE